ncbi:MAG: PQQ-dependent sugar dehydrogenase [Spirochaetales bacterium]|nr:PQQ-dependent sugar dehydrogenase [Spirochaetales bacterium]
MKVPLLLFLLTAGCASSKAGEEIPGIVLPEGFKIALYADVPNARSMALSDDGTVFVGTRKDRVYALKDTNGDNKADWVKTIVTGKNQPNGVAVYEGDLYIAEISRISVIRNIIKNLDKPVFENIYDKLPKDANHGWKYITFGPDGWLYVPVGAPCNICEPAYPYASILRLKPDGTGIELYAQGIRNTVGFDFHPKTGELWFTDNGRDNLGDNVPPDELNRVTQNGQHFGYPYLHGKNVLDPAFGDKKPGKLEIILPEAELGPHVAALGMKFYRGKMFPNEYQGQIFIAEHGSWNRSVPIGYRVTLVKLDSSQRILSYEVFAHGWLNNGRSWGRPVDILELVDGSLLLSDDKAGKIYRISYGE